MPELSPVYTEMRDTLLAVLPETSSMRPTDELPHVYGAVVDIGFEPLFTVIAFADGTTSVYDATGGAAVGLGEMVEFRVLSHGLLRAVEANLRAFGPVESTPVPLFGLVRITVLAYDGRLGVEVNGPALLTGKHKLAAIFSTAMAIMSRAQQLTEQGAGRKGPSAP
jgi:hypothetical protein